MSILPLPQNTAEGGSPKDAFQSILYRVISFISLPLAIGLALGCILALIFWVLPPTLWFGAYNDRCPTCESKDIRHSKVQSLQDHVRLMFQLRPYRCRGCWTRFSARALAAPVEETAPREDS